MDYKLLKDLPDLGAGEILIKGEDGLYHYPKGRHPSIMYNTTYVPETVEDNPEWFEPMPERIKVELHLASFPKGPLGLYKTNEGKWTPEEVKAVEALLNGESDKFTRDELINLLNWVSQNGPSATSYLNENPEKFIDRWLLDEKDNNE